jgi:hypothetical protein
MSYAEELHRVNEDKNIVEKLRRKAMWTGHSMRRKCPLKHVIEGKI